MALLGPGSTSPPAPASADAATVPVGFVETTVFSGMTNPTVIRFAPDGRVFVAEKSGIIKVFDNLTDSTPTTFADLRTNVYNFWDRGLLGMALHPSFPATPYVYVLYTYDHVLGDPSPAPRWGTPGATSDPCPNPPGATGDGCIVSGRLSRLQASGNVMTGSEQVLVENWCQQYPSHSVGTVEYGPDGALYASAGDGASFNFADYGQDGNPLNPCGDPPGGAGATLTPPFAEGGALRSQDLRTAGDPVSLDGSIIRVDPATGAALPSNPLAGSADPNARRIIAHGLRNPFRFTFRPGANELWIGDVGWGTYEEINRIPNPTDAIVENFGWPCFEGNPRQDGYDGANLNICENLYTAGNADTKPYFAYHHSDKVVAGELCPVGSSSLSGLSFEFAVAPNYPAAYQGALFFADYSRDCIWAMKRGGNPNPSPGHLETFVAAAANPVHIEFGPDGNLYYADFDGGTIRRIAPATEPPPPTTSYLSDLSWTSATNGWGPVERDRDNGSSWPGDGGPLTLNGTTYAKGLGTHAAADIRYAVTGCTRFLASVGVDDVVGANGTVTFEVYGDTTKLFDSGLMTGTTATKQIDVSISGASELRLVVTNGGNNINSDHADWALARITCGTGGDTTPPTVTGRTPAPGATGVSPTVSPTATFSEAMNASTLTTSTFTLVKQGQTTPVPAAVSYTSQVATLDPASNLDPSSTYTATVKGGASGANDLAGNPIAGDVTWTFTTAAPNQQPMPVIDTPASGTTWKVGDSISFSGHASDLEDGTLPASTLTWRLLLQHCPSNCHAHTVQTWPGVASGSFSAPDHEYPSYLELELTATDSTGGTATTIRRLDPQTVSLTFTSSPSGLQVAVSGVASTTPFSRTVIVGSTNSLSATTPQQLGATTYEFSSWSDGGAQTHNIVAPASSANYSATYVQSTGTTISYLSDLSWISATNGWGPVERDRSNGSSAAGDGGTLTLNGTTYAKGLGSHAVADIRYAIPAGCTRFLASVGVDDGVGANGSVTFEVYADTTKLLDSGLMTGTTATIEIDVPLGSASQLRLAVGNGGNNINSDHADWAAARFLCGGAPDQTAPTVTAQTPLAGATGVSPSVSPAATFSEAMNAATLTTGTFTLVRQGETTPVAASVSYANPIATLDPIANLEPGTTYVATVEGGTSGAKDIAGNALQADVTWSFTTGTNPSVTRFLSDLTWISATNGWGPVERDRSNGSSAAGDGQTITLNGTTYAKGLGAHAVSDVSYAVPTGCTRFLADVGVDDEVGSLGSIAFEVYADGNKVFDSGVMTGATVTKQVDVSVAGAAQLRLVITNGGDNINSDHGDWAAARFDCV